MNGKTLEMHARKSAKFGDLTAASLRQRTAAECATQILLREVAAPQPAGKLEGYLKG